jgi:hypothetical protein
MRDKQFGFRHRHSTPLQLTLLGKKKPSNFGEKRLIGAIILDVAKAFDTVWIDDLLNKLTLLNFPSYIVHTISSYVWGGTFETFFLATTLSHWEMRPDVDQGGLISPFPFSLYVNDMPSPSHHVELAIYDCHGYHSDVPQGDAARELTGDLPQQSSTMF